MEVSDNSFKTFTSLALVFILTSASLLFFNGVTPSFSSDDYVHLETNAFAYFIFQNLQRTYPSSGATFTIDTYRIVMNRLSPAHTVRAYEIKLPAKTMVPIFYFDGKDIYEATGFHAKRLNQFRIRAYLQM